MIFIINNYNKTSTTDKMREQCVRPQCFLKPTEAVQQENIRTSGSEEQSDFFQKIGAWSKTASHQPHQLPATLLTHSTTHNHNLCTDCHQQTP